MVSPWVLPSMSVHGTRARIAYSPVASGSVPGRSSDPCLGTMQLLTIAACCAAVGWGTGHHILREVVACAAGGHGSKLTRPLLRGDLPIPTPEVALPLVQLEGVMQAATRVQTDAGRH